MPLIPMDPQASKTSQQRMLMLSLTSNNWAAIKPKHRSGEHRSPFRDLAESSSARAIIRSATAKSDFAVADLARAVANWRFAVADAAFATSKRVFALLHLAFAVAVGGFAVADRGSAVVSSAA
jgi:hypothetical protein